MGDHPVVGDGLEENLILAGFDSDALFGAGYHVVLRGVLSTPVRKDIMLSGNDRQLL